MLGKMQSLYARYLAERNGDHVLETECGFASYRYLDDGATVYIVDIYVAPGSRNDKWASSMADEIVKKAKDAGAKKLIGSVVPSTRNSTASLRVLLGYGMTLDSSGNDFILFKKEI